MKGDGIDQAFEDTTRGSKRELLRLGFLRGESGLSTGTRRINQLKTGFLD